MAKVGVREVSAATGFSPATVSKALNRKPGVNERTAQRIWEAARELGYRQASLADTVSFVVARKTGRIIDDSTFHPAVIEGVEHQAREMGLKTTFTTLDLADAVQARGAVTELFETEKASCVVLATELDEDDLALFAPYTDRLVLLDNFSEEHRFDSVVISNRISAKCAVRYLARRGHRSIGYLSCDFRIHNFRMREQGYLEGLAAAGLAFDPSWRVELGTTFDEVYQGMASWLAAGPRRTLPTAFFADSDLIAVGALRALTEAGVRVPEEVSLFGFDDGQLSAFSAPPLTTVHVMRREMGEIAVRRLVGNMRNRKGYTCTTQVHTELIERKSVCDR